MRATKVRRKKPTPTQIFAAALALNDRGSLKHVEAQLDGALGCVLAGFADKKIAAEIIAEAVARAFAMDADVESAKPVPAAELAVAIHGNIVDALSGACPCCGEEFASTLAAPKGN